MAHDDLHEVMQAENNDNSKRLAGLEEDVNKERPQDKGGHR